MIELQVASFASSLNFNQMWNVKWGKDVLSGYRLTKNQNAYGRRYNKEL